MVVGRALRRLLFSLVIAGALLAAGGVILAASVSGEAAVPLPEADETQQVVIAVPPGLDGPRLTALAARHGGMVTRWLPRLGLALLRLPAVRSAEVAALADEPLVDFVAEHRLSIHAADVPLDPYWPQQWGPALVQGPAAWDLAWGDPSVVIAVVDSGVHQPHNDLTARTWYNPGESGVDPISGQRTCTAAVATNGVDDDHNGYVDDCRGYDFVGDDTDPLDVLGHGTVVAGIAAADTNNASPTVPGAYEGMAGMARRSSLMAVRVLDAQGAGYPFDVAAGIDYAAANGAQVINLSLTFPPSYPPTAPEVAIVRRAVETAQAADVLVVAASGNDNAAIVACPACFTGVLAVGASTSTDERAFFSNYSSRLDLVAPGVNIFSTLPYPGDGSYGLFRNSGSGTSFAAPHAAGVAALVRALRPDLHQGDVYTLLRSTTDDVGQLGFDIWTGTGRLNAYRAVSAALPDLTLALTADASSLEIGKVTMLHLQALAPGGASAGRGGHVALASDLGAVSPGIVTLNRLGQADVQFIAPRTPGVIHITATLGPVQTAIALTISPPAPAAMTLIAVPTTLLTGETATVIATVRDNEGNPVVDGLEVAFSATLGLATPPQALTTVTGQASTVFTAGTIGGTAYVTATIGGLSATVPIKVIGVGDPWVLELAADPVSIGLGGAPAVITATVRDPFGAPVAEGTKVQFVTDLGLLATAEGTTVGGQAVTQLWPGDTLGTAHVQAIAGNAQGGTAITIGAGPASTLTLDARPSLAEPGAKVTLRARARDLYGNPAAGSFVVTFSADAGTVAPAVVATTNGEAVTQLTLPGEFGPVQAWAQSGALSATTVVQVARVSYLYLPLVLW